MLVLVKGENSKTHSSQKPKAISPPHFPPPCTFSVTSFYSHSSLVMQFVRLSNFHRSSLDIVNIPIESVQSSINKIPSETLGLTSFIHKIYKYFCTRDEHVPSLSFYKKKSKAKLGIK